MGLRGAVSQQGMHALPSWRRVVDSTVPCVSVRSTDAAGVFREGGRRRSAFMRPRGTAFGMDWAPPLVPPLLPSLPESGFRHRTRTAASALGAIRTPPGRSTRPHQTVAAVETPGLPCAACTMRISRPASDSIPAGSSPSPGCARTPWGPSALRGLGLVRVRTPSAGSPPGRTSANRFRPSLVPPPQASSSTYTMIAALGLRLSRSSDLPSGDLPVARSWSSCSHTSRTSNRRVSRCT
jgi:hypothetical protein